MQSYSHPLASRHALPVSLWTRSSVDLGADPRTIALAARLGSMPGAIAIAAGARTLIANWCAATPALRSGDLSQVDAQTLAGVAHWPVDADRFKDDLEAAGILVAGRLAGWSDMFGLAHLGAPRVPVAPSALPGETAGERARRLARERWRRWKVRHAGPEYTPRPRQPLIDGETTADRRRRLARQQRARRASQTVPASSQTVTNASLTVTTLARLPAPDERVTIANGPIRKKEKESVSRTRDTATNSVGTEGSTPSGADSPAVAVFRRVFGHAPADAGTVDAMVGVDQGKVRHFEATCVAWKERGYRARSADALRGLVDRFERTMPVERPRPKWEPPAPMSEAARARGEAAYLRLFANHPARLRPSSGLASIAGVTLESLGVRRANG